MITNNILKKITYTKAIFTKDNREWVYYFKGVVSPRQISNTFKDAEDITVFVKTEVRTINIEDFIKNSQLLDSTSIKY